MTSTILLLAAVTVLRESDKMPGRYFPTIHITNHHCGTRTDYRVSICHVHELNSCHGNSVLQTLHPLDI